MIPQMLDTNNAFEVIRNKVFYIIFTELNSQLTLATDNSNTEYIEFLNTFMSPLDGVDTFNVYLERFVRFDDNELNAINISWDRSFLGHGSQGSNQKSKSRIDIQVNTMSKGTPETRGDLLSSFTMQRMLGIIRSILMHRLYVTLDLTPGIIERRWVSDMNNYRPLEAASKVNVDNIITGSNSLDVEFNEKNLGIYVENLEENYTLIEADNGRFKIETEGLL